MSLVHGGRTRMARTVATCCAAAGLALAACVLVAARSSVSTAPTRHDAWRFESRVRGIPVRDSAGVLLDAPFLGGFDVPRPQLVDLDGDERVDLFVQERPGAMMYFERVDGQWVWRSDRFQDLDVGEWFRFVDIDGDGVLDLFGEMQTGYIRVWHNAGTRKAPRFVAQGDTVRDVDGRAIVADRQNILNAVDIDCNGKLDLFIGRVQGVVDRYERDGASPDGSPRFRLLEEGWQGIEVLGPEATGGNLQRTDTATSFGEPDGSSVLRAPHGFSAPRAPRAPHGPHATGTEAAWPAPARRHGANTLAFADIGGRGVLDLFWGDFFEEGLLRFENTGTCAAPDLSGAPVRFPSPKPVLSSGYNAPTFGDVDGDGNLDLVVGVIGGAYESNRTAISNLHLVQQRPRGTWTTITTRMIPTIDVGTESAPALADINGDGLLDLIVGSKVSPTDGSTGTVTWFENVGTAREPSFRERGALPMHGDYNYAPAVVDLDGDGLPDIVVGTWRDRLQWYRNTGTRTAPTWAMADTALVTITRGTNSTPSFGDIDGDGLVDLVVGEASGTINLYRNSGTKTRPQFDLVSDHFQDIKVGRRSAPLLVDMDGDGTPDLLIGNGDGALSLWRNTRAGPGAAAMRFERDSTFEVRSYPNATPAAGDLHGTGRFELMVGTSAGGVRWLSRP